MNWWLRTPLSSLGQRKTDLLKLHSNVRALFKKARRRLSYDRAFGFHRALIGEGCLVFDIGANVGDMTAIYLELGARVVCVEPQSECHEQLMKRFGADPQVTIVPTAVGASEGYQELMLSDIRSPISSMSEKWIAAVKSSGRFSHYGWSRSVSVPVTTLDALIKEFGAPDFCKIDVEGFETEVLKGLSTTLRQLSFEFHVEFLPDAFSCLELLRGLGVYRYNYTLKNRPIFESGHYLTEEEILARLRSLPYSTLQGDVYAFRED